MPKLMDRLASLGNGSTQDAPAPRRSRSSRPDCDALEGRQLLSMMPGGMHERLAILGNSPQSYAQVQSPRLVARLSRQGIGGAVGQAGIAQGLSGSGTRGVLARSAASLLQGVSRAALRPAARLTSLSALPVGQVTAATAQPATATASAATETAAATPTALSPASSGIQGRFGLLGGSMGRTMVGLLGLQDGMTPGRPGALQGGPGLLSVASVPGSIRKLGGGPGAMGLPGGMNKPPGSLASAVSAVKTSIAGLGTDMMPALDEKAREEFQKLNDDLQAIYDKSEVTPRLEAAVRKDFEKIQAASTSEPDQAKVQALMDLTRGIDGQLPTDVQKQQIKDAFAEMIRSQGVTDQSLIDQTIADIEAVNRARNITAEDLATIAADRKAIEAKLGVDSTEGTEGPGLSPGDMPLLGGLFGGLAGI